jgi:hypothetical protein
MDETPTASDRLGKWLAPLVFLSNNWISRIGIFLVTTAGVSWLFLLPTLLKNTPNDPYIGLLTVFALPAVFFAGLALIPMGRAGNCQRERRQAPPLPCALELIEAR